MCQAACTHALGRPCRGPDVAPASAHVEVPNSQHISCLDSSLGRFSPNSSSQYLCSQASYQKFVKAKSNHYHCRISVFLLMTSIQRPSQRSTAEPLSCPKWGMGEGGKRGKRARYRPYHIKVREGCEQTSSTSTPSPKSTPCNFLSWSLFRLSLGCCETLLR